MIHRIFHLALLTLHCSPNMSFARNIIIVSQPADHGIPSQSNLPSSDIYYPMRGNVRRSGRLCSAPSDSLALRLPPAVPASPYTAVDSQASVIHAHSQTERLNLPMITLTHRASEATAPCRISMSQNPRWRDRFGAICA